ncbi:thioesterase-like superfamily-domain-containing protein [Xylariaceae sp. FL0255]|nr:thioesterase-like superfamily-domain-containing protein [Xylariaceae sp. FL0255]
MPPRPRIRVPATTTTIYSRARPSFTVLSRERRSPAIISPTTTRPIQTRLSSSSSRDSPGDRSSTRDEHSIIPKTEITLDPFEPSVRLPPTRWVSDIRTRLGKCIIFGCNEAQIQRVASIIGTVAREWRVLLAGSEGFLVGGKRGIEGQQVVWGEIDSFGHVNNVNYVRYAESSRVNWIQHFAVQVPKHAHEWKGLVKPGGVGLIMKSITADYKFPMKYPDTISVYHKLLHRSPEADDTSLVLSCMIISHRHRRVAARTTEDIEIYNYREARRTALPEFALSELQDAWRRQRAQEKWARKRIWELLKEVEALEKETWDCEGAVEDFGGAGTETGKDT